MFGKFKRKTNGVELRVPKMTVDEWVDQNRKPEKQPEKKIKELEAELKKSKDDLFLATERSKPRWIAVVHVKYGGRHETTPFEPEVKQWNPFSGMFLTDKTPELGHYTSEMKARQFAEYAMDGDQVVQVKNTYLSSADVEKIEVMELKSEGDK